MPICRWHDPIPRELKKNSIKRLLDFLIAFGRVAAYKISTQKISSFCVHEQCYGWERTCKISPICNNYQRNKYIGAKLIKDMTDLCNENYKTLRKKREQNTKILDYLGIINSEYPVSPKPFADSMQFKTLWTFCS